MLIPRNFVVPVVAFAGFGFGRWIFCLRTWGFISPLSDSAGSGLCISRSFFFAFDFWTDLWGV